MREFLRNRLGVVVAVVVLAVLVLSRRIASLAVDLWWYDAVDYRQVFTTILQTRVLVGLVGAAVLVALVAVNLQLARRMRPLFIPSTPQQAQVERYRELIDPYLPWVIAGIALLFGVTSGLALSVEWDTVLLWQHAVEVGGEPDPQFQRDIGFYLFELPFLVMVQEWLLTSLVLTTMLTVGAHYLLGGIRPEHEGDKVMPNVKAHLSVLFALLLAVWGWGYWLDRYLLNFSPRGTVTGASYTDVNAELPALEILVVVSVIAIGLVLYNVRQRGFLLPGAAVALLVLGSIFLQGAYPAAVQRFQVDPQELEQEREFIERNIDATLTAYGLQAVEDQPFEIENDLDVAQARDNEVTLENIRLWDPEILKTTYQELQSLRPYYRFNDVDVDRYTIDGELRQVMLSTRDLAQDTIPAQAQTWQNLTLTYTHGYGAVASQVNTSTASKQPVFLASDIPPQGVDELVPDQEAGVYFGEGLPEYNIVGTRADELDYERATGAEQVVTEYDGAGGVGLGSLLRRVAFAIDHADTNILLSGLIEDDSQILIRRDVDERVREVAPWLRLDRDPYAVVLDGRIVWVQDAYTTSSAYPYSERRPFETADGVRTVNYVRNSVKAVVDAYDGTVTLYAVDTEDPLLQAWSDAFPGTITSIDELPDGLREHFRYPKDLFTLQSQVYTTYHIPTTAGFYNKADEWRIPPDAAAEANDGGTATGSSDQMLDPYYLLMRLPGQQDEEFVLIQPYLAASRPNMVAWLAARSDPDNYGELFAVQFPSDSEVLGTRQAQTRIEQDDDIAEYITLRAQQGSNVRRGNMIVLPIEESIVYVEPLFLEGGSADIPELARVVLVMGDEVVFEPTLAEAVASLVGGDPIDANPVEGAPDQPGEDPTDQQDQDPAGEGGDQQDQADDGQQDGSLQGADTGLLVDALEAFAEAEAALDDGDLGEYQRLIGRARDLLERAVEEGGVDPGVLEDAATDDDAGGGTSQDGAPPGGGGGDADTDAQAEDGGGPDDP